MELEPIKKLFGVISFIVEECKWYAGPHEHTRLGRREVCNVSLRKNLCTNGPHTQIDEKWLLDD